MTMTVFRPEINLRPADLARVAALNRPGNAGARIAALVLELVEMLRAETLLAPRFICERRRVLGVMAGTILLEGATSLDAPLVVKRLQGMQYLVIGLSTIGAALEERVQRLFQQRKGLRALILDEIGNVAVRKVANAARRQIRRDAGNIRLESSSAISPGADGFPISRQARLCELVRAADLGVKIQGGVMLHPAKSLTFVAGLGMNMPRWSQADECQSCRAAPRCRSRVTSAGMRV